MKYILLILAFVACQLMVSLDPAMASAQVTARKDYKLKLTPEQKAKVDEMLKREAERASKTEEHEYKLSPEEKKKVDKLLKEQPEEEVVFEDGRAVPKKNEPVVAVEDGERKTKIILGGGFGFGWTDYEVEYIEDNLDERGFINIRGGLSLTENSTVGLTINLAGRNREYSNQDVSVSFSQVLAEYSYFFDSLQSGFYVSPRIGVTSVRQTIDPDNSDDNTSESDTDFAIGLAPGYLIQLGNHVGIGLEVDYTQSFGHRSYPTVIGLTYFKAWF